MRIEVNNEVKKELDRIKAENYIFGKGHSDTIAFLIKYYKSHEKIEEMIKRHFSEIPTIIEKSFLNALRTAVTNLLKPREGDPQIE
jgi:hypothetical protein